jgi:ribosomal protein S18 acetylase RimI-like enzyme
MAYVIESLGVDDVDRVEALWNAMVAHHQAIVRELPPLDLADSWRRRRAQYVEWLTESHGHLLVAVPADDRDAPPVGYALVRTRAPGVTWDQGERVGELESLAVSAHARGAGVGTLLIRAARERLRADGVAYWAVEVMDANAGARRLYEREGFGPWSRALLGRV